MPSLNPNHPVSHAIGYEQLMKICAVLVMKLGGRTEVTPEDLVELSALFRGDCPTLVTHAHPRHIELFLVSTEEGMQLARTEGGLPQ